ncbi:hypothetical protein Hanom_Chr12g01162521 [Helianthus anomalus]
MHVFPRVSGAWQPRTLIRRRFLFLSPDEATPYWATVCLLTVHFPIALNAMCINIRRFPTNVPPFSPTLSNFKNFLILFSDSPSFSSPYFASSFLQNFHFLRSC